MEKLTTVAVFGTFDILHQGHIDFFRQAKAEAGLHSHLVVVVARDVNVEKVKGELPKNNEQTRLANVKKAHHVNEAVLGGVEDKLKIVEVLAPDILCLGYDQDSPEDLENQLKKRNIIVKVRRMKPYEEHIYKSSKLT
ncbi:adenylyltransferase/cytidyltransferase family protein [candidate division KSB1 bacterium]